MGIGASKIFLRNLLRKMSHGFAAGDVATGMIADHYYVEAFRIDSMLHNSINGFITDGETGEPIRRVAVRCSGVRTVYSDRDGYFEIWIPQGEQKLTFDHVGYMTVRKTINNSVTALDIKMYHPMEIKGTVVDAVSMKPLKDVWVYYGKNSLTFTDESGIYHFDKYNDIVPGTETLTFSKEGYNTLSIEAVCESNKTNIYDARLYPVTSGTPTAVPTKTTQPSTITPVTPTPAIAVTPTPIYTESPVTDFEFELSDSGDYWILIKYSGNSDLVVIPEKVDGKYVKEIGSSAFYKCTCLTTVMIPDNVISIGEYAFVDCTNLKEVIIPESVRIIGGGAFSRCSNLSDIKLPSGITSLEQGVFDGCESLTSIIIPDNVISIGKQAFCRCKNLVDVTIGNGVTSIGEWAFGLCPNLTDITIPDSVTSIGEAAFIRSTGLANIKIPNSVTFIGSSAFSGCSSLASITLSNSLTSLEDFTFSTCSSLVDLTIPESVEIIGEAAFLNCSNLTDITIPDAVTSIGRAAFSGCSNLTDVRIPDAVTSIGKDAFYGCSNLTNITIPSNVTSIGDSVFGGCTKITNVYIKDLSAWCGISFDNVTSNPLYYGKNVYIDGKLTTDVNIPYGIEKIKQYAFTGTSITNISLPNSVTSIEESAFYRCRSLTGIMTVQA